MLKPKMREYLFKLFILFSAGIALSTILLAVILGCMTTNNNTLTIMVLTLVTIIAQCFINYKLWDYVSSKSVYDISTVTDLVHRLTQSESKSNVINLEQHYLNFYETNVLLSEIIRFKSTKDSRFEDVLLQSDEILNELDLIYKSVEDRLGCLEEDLSQYKDLMLCSHDNVIVLKSDSNFISKSSREVNSVIRGLINLRDYFKTITSEQVKYSNKNTPESESNLIMKDSHTIQLKLSDSAEVLENHRNHLKSFDSFSSDLERIRFGVSVEAKRLGERGNSFSESLLRLESEVSLSAELTTALDTMLIEEEKIYAECLDILHRAEDTIQNTQFNETLTLGVISRMDNLILGFSNIDKNIDSIIFSYQEVSATMNSSLESEKKLVESYQVEQQVGVKTLKNLDRLKGLSKQLRNDLKY